MKSQYNKELKLLFSSFLNLDAVEDSTTTVK